MMKIRSLATFLTAALLLAAQTANAADIAQYNLGEDDPGAFAGFTGNATTVDGVGTNDLTKAGDPTYNGDVPAGGSTLSMAFDGDGDYYSGPAPITDHTTNDITLSFDAKGSDGAAGFSFLASLGSNFGGFSVVEIGGNVQAFMPGAGAGDGGFDLDQDTEWHHYDLEWNAWTTTLTLSVDSTVVSTRVGLPANNQIVDFFTIGGNSRSAAPDNLADPLFEGSFNGLIDNVMITATEIPEPTSLILLGMGSVTLMMSRRRNRV